MQLWHGGKTSSNGRVVLNDLSFGDGGCSLCPHLPRLPKNTAHCLVARIPAAHLEHLEGKMMPVPPARQDKRCEVGQTSTQQERRGLNGKKRVLTEMRISEREIQHQEEKIGNP